jgi:hypothetical protein
MLEVFVDAFLYEPANVVVNVNNTFRQQMTYLHNNPEIQLHTYLHAFMDHSSTVVDCCVVIDDLPLCTGCGEGKHHFMRAEGFCKCDKCKEILCRECTFIKKKMMKMKQNNTVTTSTYLNCQYSMSKLKMTCQVIKYVKHYDF